ncbi:helix-turn-helix transcriptional regulator [Georgenia satyanarayanai]|uniref:helix-turn-helix transcriptional regulator n=1 Tax=Georgenia satyanarayanai TaxID=860221 RepID=UPI0021AC843B|nr:WYL domain-containing protein [Georgenia satyanarayanai]
MTRVDPAERLLDLLIALRHAPGRLTKADIRASVNGYHDAANDVAFERMFERDKDLLRHLGVPIVTDVDPVHEDAVGYRLDTAGYSLPEVTFTAAEIGVLSLAATVWQDAHLHGSAHRGLTKLRAVAAGADPDAHIGVALRVQAAETALGPLLDAIGARQAVSFTYRAASTGEETARRVQPWRLVSRDRGWYLIGYDADRDAPRVFRLSRVVGTVRATGPTGAHEVPEHDAQAILAGSGGGRVHAVLAVLPERGAALRARAVEERGERDGRDVVVVETDDELSLAAEIAAYGPAVLVIEPPALREAVLARLRAVAALGEAARA